MENEIMDIEMCASYMLKSVHTIRKYIKDGVIPHYKKEGSVYFIKSEILKWILDGKFYLTEPINRLPHE